MTMTPAFASFHHHPPAPLHACVSARTWAESSVLGGVSLDVGVLALPQIWAQALRSGFAPNMGTSITLWLRPKYGHKRFALASPQIWTQAFRSGLAPNMGIERSLCPMRECERGIREARVGKTRVAESCLLVFGELSAGLWSSDVWWSSEASRRLPGVPPTERLLLWPVCLRACPTRIACLGLERHCVAGSSPATPNRRRPHEAGRSENRL